MFCEHYSTQPKASLDKCLRQILSIRWPNAIRNKDLWQQTNQDPIQQQLLTAWILMGWPLSMEVSVFSECFLFCFLFFQFYLIPWISMDLKSSFSEQIHDDQEVKMKKAIPMFRPSRSHQHSLDSFIKVKKAALNNKLLKTINFKSKISMQNFDFYKWNCGHREFFLLLVSYAFLCPGNKSHPKISLFQVNLDYAYS